MRNRQFQYFLNFPPYDCKNGPDDERLARKDFVPAVRADAEMDDTLSGVRCHRLSSPWHWILRE